MFLKYILLLVLTIHSGVASGNTDIDKAVDIVLSKLSKLPDEVNAGYVHTNYKNKVDINLTGLAKVRKTFATAENSRKFVLQITVNFNELKVSFNGKTYNAGKTKVHAAVWFKSPSDQTVVPEETCRMKTVRGKDAQHLPCFRQSLLDVFGGDFNKAVQKLVQVKIRDLIIQSIDKAKFDTLFDCPKV